MTIPIQALVVRTQKDLDEAAKRSGHDSVTLAAGRPTTDGASAAATSSSAGSKNPDVQGLFAVRNGRAIFVPVSTGIIGVTDIEVLDGVRDGDQIITGSYKTLRTLKPDSRVKVDNSAPKVEDQN